MSRNTLPALGLTLCLSFAGCADPEQDIPEPYKLAKAMPDHLAMVFGWPQMKKFGFTRDFETDEWNCHGTFDWPAGGCFGAPRDQGVNFSGEAYLKAVYELEDRGWHFDWEKGTWIQPSGKPYKRGDPIEVSDAQRDYPVVEPVLVRRYAEEEMAEMGLSYDEASGNWICDGTWDATGQCSGIPTDEGTYNELAQVIAAVAMVQDGWQVDWETKEWVGTNREGLIYDMETGEWQTPPIPDDLVELYGWPRMKAAGFTQNPETGAWECDGTFSPINLTCSGLSGEEGDFDWLARNFARWELTKRGYVYDPDKGEWDCKKGKTVDMGTGLCVDATAPETLDEAANSPADLTL